MSSNSAIEWTDATWNPIVGCTIVSPGCTNCYAMKMAARIIAMAGASKTGLHYDKTIKDVNGRPVWTGVVNRAPESTLIAPLRWKRPRKIFVNSMGDLFHESIPDEWIDRVFAVMALCPQHTFQVLTKRAERMREYMTANTSEGWMTGHAGGRVGDQCHLMRTDTRAVGPVPHHDPGERWWPLPNVWLGVSCERQQEADERIPHLLQTPAAVRFISVEPLLGPIDLGNLPSASGIGRFLDSLHNAGCEFSDVPSKLDWVIVGGESGPNARPMNPQWARKIRNDCLDAGIPFFFKQYGAWQAKTNRDGWTLGKDHIVFSEDDTPELYTGWPPGGGTNAPHEFLERVGKKAAGRLLDGREHNEFPPQAAPSWSHDGATMIAPRPPESKTSPEPKQTRP